MITREALISDIPQMQVVRNAVKENVLSNPALVTNEHYVAYLAERGKGWLCETRDRVVGFSIVDLKENNVWALFIHPDYERLGIGKRLHDKMLDWYFDQTEKTIWLGTLPGTRAEASYRKAGWKETGLHGDAEIKFEMCFSDWCSIKSKRHENPWKN